MPEVAAIVLAAGRGSRFGAGEDDSKVLAPHQGLTLVAHVVAAVHGSRAAPVVVVTGHAAGLVAMSVAGPDVTIVHNADYGRGMAGSLKAGLAALPARSAGVLILLGDMPLVTTATLDALIAAFEAGGADAIVPTYQGRRGNPVLIGRALFPAMTRLEGDQGARRLLEGRDTVRALAVDDPGVVVDVDTPDALRALL